MKNNNNIKSEDNEEGEDIFRILITTDNHLGFREDDKIVGNDSFYSFNEALQMYFMQQT